MYTLSIDYEGDYLRCVIVYVPVVVYKRTIHYKLWMVSTLWVKTPDAHCKDKMQLPATRR